MSVLMERAVKSSVTLLAAVGSGILAIAAAVVVFSANAGNYTPMLLIAPAVLAGGSVLWAIVAKSRRLRETGALARVVVILMIAAGVCFLAALFALAGVSIAGLLTDMGNAESPVAAIPVLAFLFAMFGWVPFLNHAYEWADFKNQHQGRQPPPKSLVPLFWWVLASFPVAIFWAVLWGILVGAAIVTPIHW